eukprot:3719680-Prymnesium_polylepis.1
MTSGQFVGTSLALLCGPLAARWWPAVFLLFGALGLVWCAAFAALGASTPDESSCVGEAERLHIGACGAGGGERFGGAAADSDTTRFASGTRSSSLSDGDAMTTGAPPSPCRRSRARGGVAAVCAAVPWRRCPHADPGPSP